MVCIVRGVYRSLFLLVRVRTKHKLRYIFSKEDYMIIIICLLLLCFWLFISRADKSLEQWDRQQKKEDMEKYIEYAEKKEKEYPGWKEREECKCEEAKFNFWKSVIEDFAEPYREAEKKKQQEEKTEEYAARWKKINKSNKIGY